MILTVQFARTTHSLDVRPPSPLGAGLTAICWQIDPTETTGEQLIGKLLDQGIDPPTHTIS